MIPHRNPSFLIDKSSPKQIKTPGSPPGVFIWGQPSAAGVTPHCAGAARPRRSHSEPGSPSPPTASMKSSGAALFAACGPAMSCPARQFLPGASLPHSARRVLPVHAKGPDGGVFFYSGRSRISCASAGSRWERDRTQSSHKAGELLHCHRSHRVSGRFPPPLCPPGTSRPRKKAPHSGGVFFYSGRSRISCASAGSRW